MRKAESGDVVLSSAVCIRETPQEIGEVMAALKRKKKAIKSLWPEGRKRDNTNPGHTVYHEKREYC